MIALVAIMTLGAACSKEEKDLSTSLKVTTNIADDNEATRSVITSFSNSTIGVYVDDDSDIYSPTVNSIANIKTGASTVSPSPAIYINSEAKVYAWYPATEGELENPTSSSTKAIEVLDKDNFGAENQIDYLWATPTDVSKSNRRAMLEFNHALSKIVFSIKIGDNFKGNGVLTKILFASNLTPFLSGNGTMNIADGTISGLTATDSLEYNGDVTLTTTATNIVTLMAPTTLNDTTLIEFTIDGAEYSAEFPIGTIPAWLTGTTYTYNITVDGVELYIDDNVIVNDWEAGGSTDISIK